MKENIYQLLKDDHQKVKDLLSELLTLKDDDSYREVIVEQIRSELIPHSRAEETVFYNSVRAVGSDDIQIMHSFKEHMEAEGLLRLLQVKDSGIGDWKETARKLQDALEHHINEEENEIFPKTKNIFSDEEAVMMGSAFSELKEEVKDEGMIKSSIDLVVNLMPPRFAKKLKDLKSSEQRS